jgi:hypothetical protein
MSESDVPYEVGYGKPPKAGQFEKGRSGNPKGRPRGSRSVESMLDKVTQESIPVTENGRTRRMPKSEAILRQLIAKALSGNLGAIKDVVALKRNFEAAPDPTRIDGPDAEKNRAVLQKFLEKARSAQRSELSSATTDKPQNGENSHD